MLPRSHSYPLRIHWTWLLPQASMQDSILTSSGWGSMCRRAGGGRGWSLGVWVCWRVDHWKQPLTNDGQEFVGQSSPSSSFRRDNLEVFSWEPLAGLSANLLINILPYLMAPLHYPCFLVLLPQNYLSTNSCFRISDKDIYHAFVVIINSRMATLLQLFFK
jgi:hypothetical protein